MEAMLVMNGYELVYGIDEAESIILKLASGNLPREELANWIRLRLQLLRN